MKKKFTLILASMFLTLGAWAQIEFTFTRGTWPNATVEVSGADGVTASITATAASGAWNTGGALANATNILCANTNTNATATTPITYTLTIRGLSEEAAYNSVVFTHKAMNSGGNYQPAGDDIRHCNFTLTANGTEFSKKTDENIWVANGSQNNSKDIEFTSTNNELPQLTANGDGTSTLVLTINKGTENKGCFYGLTKIKLSNSVEVTYNYMFNGTQVKSETVTQEIGTAYEAPAIDYVTFAYPDGNVTKETTIVEVTCTQNLPFTVSTDYANATWYYMTIRSDNQKYVARSESAPYANSKTITAGDNGLWAFMGDAFNGIQVINKGAGDGFTLGYAGTTTESYISMTEGQTTWTIEEGKGGFILGQGENVYAHDYNSKLQIWNNTSAATDAGSAFNVFTAEELTNTKKSELQALIDQVGAYEAGTTLGSYTEASVANLTTPLATANTAVQGNSLEEILNATTALQAAINNMEVVVPTKGKFYRFKHPTADAYMLSDETTVDGNKRLAMGALESNEVSSIFYYGEDGTLLSYANGRYLSEAAQGSSADWTCLAVGTKGSAATFGAGSAVGRLGFYLASGRAYWSGHQTYVDAGGSFGSNPGYDWIIEEVTTLPVAVSAAGYATLYAPVALTVPTGVTAYTGALNDENDVLTLTAINTGVTIPANTAVILEGAANTYDFAVTTDATAIEGNDLVGTVETEVKSGTVYTLQSHDTYGVAFKQYTGTNLTGFKAYLVLPEATEAAAIRINRGDEEGTTAIDNVALTIDNVVIYDLAGRRVEKMEKGIYIVNGKKVIK